MSDDNASAESTVQAEEEQGPHAVSSRTVLADEYRLIWSGEPQPDGAEDRAFIADYHAKVFERNQAALCLSGGGIRSAAFALGVLQALSRKRILTGFHYLSTVSGGGYIGSWLQRWMAEPGCTARSVMETLAGPEPVQVSALRENSNFITPRVGIGSNDTWTALAISIRNIAVNWLLFAPLFLLLALVPNLFANGLITLPANIAAHSWLYGTLLSVYGVLVSFALFNLGRALPSYGEDGAPKGAAAEYWVRRLIVLPLVAAAVVGTFVLSCDLFWRPFFYIPGTLLAGTTLLAGIFASLAGLVGRKPVYGRIFARDLGFWLIAVAIASATVELGVQALPIPLVPHAEEAQPGAATVPPVAVRPETSGIANRGIQASPPKTGTTWRSLHGAGRYMPPDAWRAAMLALLGPILLLWAQVTAFTIFAAFRTGSSPGIQPDSDREWLARLTALVVRPILYWAAVGFSSLLLFDLLQALVPGFSLSLSGLIAALSAAAAVFGGHSDRTGMVAGAKSKLMRFIPLQGMIALATFVFIIALLMVLSRIELSFADFLGRLLGKYWTAQPHWLSPYGAGHWAMVLTLLALLLILSRVIRANRFSLNGLYRNRIARAFLGGARIDREPQPFTGFDPKDNIRLHKLAPSLDGRRILYPVINVALNVTQSEKLAWQERKAEPFIFSPLYSGSAMLRSGDRCTTERNGAYVSSRLYGGNEPDLGMEGSGVSLASAIAISGAAASPNMGYHSSPATAFLMTLFNVRLGAWMPNPARCDTLKERIERSDPSNAVWPLLSELRGSTDDRGLNIYLSDGGHFENLGLYEMIRRRCRYIVLSDAGADPDCRFEDLGNAVRKIKIDLGIDIDFEQLRISSRAKPIDPQFAWALGKIHYPEGEGHLLYIKPSLFGRLPVDVRSYAEASATFPHETTGDQFFSESQFESYRRLGDFFADELGKRTDASGRRTDRFDSVKDFFDAVEAEHRGEKPADEDKEERRIIDRIAAALGLGPREEKRES